MYQFLIGFYLLQAMVPASALPPVFDLHQEAPHIQEAQQLRAELKELRVKLQQSEENLKYQQSIQSSRSASWWPFSGTAHTHDFNHDPAATAHFEDACHQLRNGQRVQAIESFESFVTRYPRHRKQAEAHYFLVQLHLLEGNVDKTLAYAKTFTQQYTKNKRYPEVKLLTGLTYLAQQNYPIATKLFKQLTHHYPNTPVGEKAAIQLQKLEQI